MSSSFLLVISCLVFVQRIYGCSNGIVYLGVSNDSSRIIESHADDSGSSIWINLLRSRTAREAIQTISDLMSHYGYAPEGESFSIGDHSKTWVMEIIGKGISENWAAHRPSDGYICAHPNQTGIHTFELNDSENSLYSSDVISFARKIGLYPADARDEDFSISDIYDTVTFDRARFCFCDARVWSETRPANSDLVNNHERVVLSERTNAMPSEHRSILFSASFASVFIWIVNFILLFVTFHISERIGKNRHSLRE
jgi:hypothetical protein